MLKDEGLGSVVQYLTGCYRKQHQLYEELMLITREMNDIIVDKDENISTIEQALNKRDKIIREISEIDTDVKSKKQRAVCNFNLKGFKAADLSGLVSSRLVSDFVLVTRAIDEIIRKIIVVDNQNQEYLKSKFKNVAIELKKFQVHHDIQNIYLEQPGKYPEPRFFDKRE